MQVKPCEDISINHQANTKRNADWEATTKRKWAKTKTVINNSFEISTQNRFSCWEEEDTNDPVLCMIGEIKTEKITVIKGITRENKVKLKKQRKKVEAICDWLNDFESKNAFSTLGEFTEAEIETVLEVKMVNDTHNVSTVFSRFDEHEIEPILRMKSKTFLVKSSVDNVGTRKVVRDHIAAKL